MHISGDRPDGYVSFEPQTRPSIQRSHLWYLESGRVRTGFTICRRCGVSLENVSPLFSVLDSSLADSPSPGTVPKICPPSEGQAQATPLSIKCAKPLQVWDAAMCMSLDGGVSSSGKRNRKPQNPTPNAAQFFLVLHATRARTHDKANPHCVDGPSSHGSVHGPASTSPRTTVHGLHVTVRLTRRTWRTNDDD